MSAVACLQLMLGLIKDHEEIGSEPEIPPTVLPVIHEEFDRDEELLLQAFRRADGVLYCIDPDKVVLDGDPPSDLVAAIEVTLESYGGLDVTVTQSEGKIKLSSDPKLEKSVANNLFLASLARILSADLGKHPLVGVAYSAESLDILRRSVLWELLVHQLPRHLPKAIKTFVPIVAGRVDYPRHCAGTPSARFAVIGESLRTRKIAQSNMGGKLLDIAPDRATPLVLFLGAGASASAGIPVGDALRDSSIERIVGPSPGADMAEVFRLWARDHHRLLPSETDLTPRQFAARLTLERVLREEFRKDRERGQDRAESQAVKELAHFCQEALDRVPRGREALQQLIAEHPRCVVITVNFDRQIEEGLDPPYRVVVTPDEFDVAAELVGSRLRGETDEIPILKIHGTIDRPETLVADIDETELGLPTAMRSVLEGIFEVAADEQKCPVRWIWAGCSMRDIDVNQWMRTKDCRQIYDLWVDPLPGPTLDRFVEERRSDLLPALEDHKITELPDVFFPALAAHIGSLPALE